MMLRRKIMTMLCVGAGAVLGTKIGAGCISYRCEGTSEFIEPGDHTVVEVTGDPGIEWVLGAAVNFDAEAGVLTIRYTREGSTYEVRYTQVE